MTTTKPIYGYANDPANFPVPAPTHDPAIIRAQFDAADPALKNIVKDAHTAGLIDGLRDVTIFASREEADAAWNALPGYVHQPKYPPRK